MYVIQAINVNDALSNGLRYLNTFGKREYSRNGEVLVAPGPVTTMYARSDQRVLFSPLRNANPFFHLMEALWMLAGRDDVQWPSYFNKKFLAYSDDGVSLYGAYGNRWRNYFGFDQIHTAVQKLIEDPTTRRVVITMWAPSDMRIDSADIPCNTQIYFRINEGHLDMTVTCRSNDMFWGAHGANAVHMSMLHEFVARAVGVELGIYYQISNNYHLYTEVEALSSAESRTTMADKAADHNLYTTPFLIDRVEPFPIMTREPAEWMQDLSDFMTNPLQSTLFMDPFFKNVAIPMFRSWYERKEKISDGLEWANRIVASDWRVACCEWIMRRA